MGAVADQQPYRGARWYEMRETAATLVAAWDVFRRQPPPLVETASGQPAGWGAQLDVYKRQVYALVVAHRAADFDQDDLRLTLVAVSYTHLDVYKRQARLWIAGRVEEAALGDACLLYTSRCV